MARSPKCLMFEEIVFQSYDLAQKQTLVSRYCLANRLKMKRLSIGHHLKKYQA